MKPLRILSSEVVDTTGFVESAFAETGSVSVTTTGVTAATEVQLIDVTLTENAFKLTHGATSITTASLDATPTIGELVTAIQGAAGYGSLPFTVAAGTGDQLELTWATAVTVTELATFEVSGEAAGSVAETTTGDGSTAEIQDVTSVSLVDGRTYTLDFNGTSVSATLSANVGQGVTVMELISQFRVDANWSGLGVRIDWVSASAFKLTWQAVGAVAFVATLTFADYSAGTTAVDTAGATAATEVRTATGFTLDPLSIYQLTLDATVLTGLAADATPTTAEIVTLLQADADYAACPFTIAADGDDIVATWKTAVTVGGVSTFEYKARVEGPYSSVMAANVSVVRVAPVVACHVAIGKDAEATTTASPYMPAGSVEYFATNPGERVSVIAASGEGDVNISQMIS